LVGNYPVFMTGEVIDRGNENISYTERLVNLDHPWERTQIVTRASCHDSYQAPAPSARSQDVLHTVLTDDVHLRQTPSANAVDLLGGDMIPAGTPFSFTYPLACQQLRNGYTWCAIFWPSNGVKIRGWVSAYYLRMNDGTRVACYLHPDSHQCDDVTQELPPETSAPPAAQDTQPYTPSPPTMQDAPSWIR
jgi:hypothetical protein